MHVKIERWKTAIWNRRAQILKVALIASIVGVFALDVWLGTCGFDGCPSPREIQAYRPDEGGRIYDRTGRLMGRLAIVRRLNIPISQVPVHVRQAFVAVEDRRFYKHNGVDWYGFVRATLRNVKAMGVREGFSTITMQAARNSFVVNQYKNRSLPNISAASVDATPAAHYNARHSVRTVANGGLGAPIGRGG